MTAAPSLVTIGIPCFNAQSTIARAVRSALFQNWPLLEILVVDDASSDESIRASERAIASDPRARIIRHETNKGPAGARNTILEEAAGDFIVFFDDDDESLPERVRAQIEAIIACEELTGAEHVACYASGRRIYPNGYELALPAIGSRGLFPTGPPVVDYLLFRGRNTAWFMGAGTPACALAARRRTLTVAGGFDTTLRRVEDADLAVRLAFLGAYFVGTSKILFLQHATHSPDKSNEVNFDAEMNLAEKYAEYLRSVGRYEYARRWPRLRYWHFKRNYLRFIADLAELFLRYPLTVTRHLLTTGPRRLLHESRIRRRIRA